PDKGDPIAEPLVHGLERFHLRAARHAPRCPEVDHDGPSGETCERDPRVRVPETREVELGCRRMQLDDMEVSLRSVGELVYPEARADRAHSPDHERGDEKPASTPARRWLYRCVVVGHEPYPTNCRTLGPQVPSRE